MFTLSPDPARIHSTIKVDFNEPLTDDAVLTICNCKGQLVKTLVCKAGSSFIKFTVDNKGIYTVNYRNSFKTFKKWLDVRHPKDI